MIWAVLMLAWIQKEAVKFAFIHIDSMILKIIHSRNVDDTKLYLSCKLD